MLSIFNKLLNLLSKVFKFKKKIIMSSIKNFLFCFNLKIASYSAVTVNLISLIAQMFFYYDDFFNFFITAILAMSAGYFLCTFLMNLEKSIMIFSIFQYIYATFAFLGVYLFFNSVGINFIVFLIGCGGRTV